MAQDKIWCGQGKKREFSNGGSITTISIDLDTIEQYFEQYGKRGKNNGKRYITLKVASKREEDQYGNTHSVEIDTWKPDNSHNNQGGDTYNAHSQNVNSGNNQGFQGSSFKPSSGFQGGNSNFDDDDVPF